MVALNWLEIPVTSCIWRMFVGKDCFRRLLQKLLTEKYLFHRGYRTKWAEGARLIPKRSSWPYLKFYKSIYPINSHRISSISISPHAMNRMHTRQVARLQVSFMLPETEVPGGLLVCTPPKTNMSPENWWLEDAFPIEIVPFKGDMLVFRGVIFNIQ